MNTLRTTKRLLNSAFLAGSLVMNSAPLHAVPITGILNTTGSVAVTSTTIDFLPAGTGTGDFGVDPFTQTGSFSGLAGTSETHQNLQQLLATINGGGSVSATYSANFIVSSPEGVPEPATITFMLGDLGLIVVGAVRKRRASSAA